MSDDVATAIHQAGLADAYAEGRLVGLREAANWLRRNANAERDKQKRAAFIEAHNAMRALIQSDGHVKRSPVHKR